MESIDILTFWTEIIQGDEKYFLEFCLHRDPLNIFLENVYWNEESMVVFYYDNNIETHMYEFVELPRWYDFYDIALNRKGG